MSDCYWCEKPENDDSSLYDLKCICGHTYGDHASEHDHECCAITKDCSCDRFCRASSYFQEAI